ncbi:tetratricopeptide repeat protein [Dapis sp. BLCC M229]|uniref:tetratricopeptide repeat protein n=1 Tax=Dapis sp. BLCC M229 TaxID=3400188 RepID=UPI003CF82F12
MYTKKGDYEKAIADYDRAIQLDPEFVYAYLNRGLTYNDRGEYEKALADFN